MFDVLLHDSLVGKLEPRGRGVRFTYSGECLDDPETPPLSLSLPKREEPYPDSKAGPFFRNLLPEQAYRRLVAASVGVAPENDLALLGAIGGECPGAVSIWPTGERPALPPDYRAVSASELEGLFSATGRQEMAVALTRGRLSLAGAQEKIALLHDSAGWWLPLNGAVTSHIVKQSTVQFSQLLENEVLCMSLAQAAGLEVATVEAGWESVRLFTTRRFDRVERADTLCRLHQEDFCQALGFDPVRKYQHDGGPGIKQCASLILRFSAAPAVDLDRLCRWVAFNYLIGNEDAHAKNLALLYGPTGTRLAPFYDIVSTRVYDGLDRRLSMKIGRSWDAHNVQAADWHQLARAVGLPWPAVRETIAETVEAVSDSLPDVVGGSRERYGDVAIHLKIVQVVGERRERLRKELARRGRKR